MDIGDVPIWEAANGFLLIPVGDRLDTHAAAYFIKPLVGNLTILSNGTIF